MIEMRKRDGKMEGVSFWVLGNSDENQRLFDWVGSFCTFDLLTVPFQVCMGCKEPEACIANKKQNFVGSWKSWQCRPWNWTKVWLIPYDSPCMTCATWVMRSFRLERDFKSSNTSSRALQRVGNAVPNQIANLKWDVSNQLQLATGDLIYWNKTIFLWKRYYSKSVKLRKYIFLYRRIIQSAWFKLFQAQ